MNCIYFINNSELSAFHKFMLYTYFAGLRIVDFKTIPQYIFAVDI